MGKATKAATGALLLVSSRFAVIQEGRTMLENLPPDIQNSIGLAVTWLWTQYGKPATTKVAKRAVNEGRWRFGLEKYYESLYWRVGFVRILGRMEAEPLENIFTHVNVLDKLQAERRYDVERLQSEFAPRDFAWQKRVRRVAGDDVVTEFNKLFILGKPGAGKTTFLKHTALRAIEGEIDKVPIFITLKELSDSGKEMFDFIVHQFDTHQFPEPDHFVQRLLKDGNAIVLLDGLDEVNVEDERRSKLISMVNDFVYKYGDCPMVMTCRVAATEYSFTQFQYVEMADFDEEQIGRYIDRWFVGDEEKRRNCRRTLLEEKENRPIRELAQVPLLLSLLCLVFEELNSFPSQRHEIYEDATRALLTKWDASRNITRDTVYKELSLRRKEQMLACLAAKTFNGGEYFVPERRLTSLLEEYLQGLAGLEESDGGLVLQSMEAQHGILVERAHRIHSFSHLTLQEYFTARYIVANERRAAVERLIENVGDKRWEEVFLLVAGMLHDATEFANLYVQKLSQIAKADAQVTCLLEWAEEKRRSLSPCYRPAAVRAALLYAGLPADLQPGPDDADRRRYSDRSTAFLETERLARALDQDVAWHTDVARIFFATQIPLTDLSGYAAAYLNEAVGHTRGVVFTIYPTNVRSFTSNMNMSDIINHLGRNLRHLVKSLPHDDLMRRAVEYLVIPAADAGDEHLQRYMKNLAKTLAEHRDKWDVYKRLSVARGDQDECWQLSLKPAGLLGVYTEAVSLFVRCLDVAYVSNREAIEDRLLLPPE